MNTSKSILDLCSSIHEKKIMTEKDDPCWKGYDMVGTKEMDGKEVPNCVPAEDGE